MEQKDNQMNKIVCGYIRKEFANYVLFPVCLKQLIQSFSNKLIQSHILTKEQDNMKVFNLLKEMTKDDKFNLKLLYRASLNLHSSSKFYELCNGYKPTLLIGCNDRGNIFGGYINIEWRCNLDFFESDCNFFFFVIQSNEILVSMKCNEFDIHHCINIINNKQTSSLFLEYCSLYYSKENDCIKHSVGGTNYEFNIIELEVFSIAFN